MSPFILLILLSPVYSQIASFGSFEVADGAVGYDWAWTQSHILNTGCRYNDFRGTYALESNCQSELSIAGKYSNPDPEQDVRCCLFANCVEDDKHNPMGTYSCLNTDKWQACFGGLGTFIPHLCPGLPADVQCCIEQQVQQVATNIPPGTPADIVRLINDDIPKDPYKNYEIPQPQFDNW